jgi:hypothetical protein
MNRLRRSSVALAVGVACTVGLIATPVKAAPPYSVTLSADPTSLETGEATTLTTTASQDFTGTRWTTYVFDQTDPTWYRTCKVQTCSFSVTQASPGTHSYVAYIARDRSDPRYPPTQIQATSNTVAVTWTQPTFTVRLDAEATWVTPGSTVRLLATTNKDMTGRPFAIQIFDLTSGERLAICDSGTTCPAEVEQVTPATRAYQAFVAEPGTTPPPPNAQASSEVVTITWSILPDPTRPPNVGGGPVTGIARFDPPGVPPLGAECETTSFTFAGDSTSAWVNGSGTAYVGPLTITASGGSDCERASTGDGALTVWAEGTNDLGQELSCGPLDGTFTRVATDVTLTVSGDCEINDFDAFRISFVAHGEFVPTNPGGGLTEPVTEATFAGAFTVFPN